MNSTSLFTIVGLASCPSIVSPANKLSAFPFKISYNCYKVFTIQFIIMINFIDTLGYFFIPLPNKNNKQLKTKIKKANYFLKEKKILQAGNCYQEAFHFLLDDWLKFNNEYYYPWYRFISNTEYKFIYCPIPKVANTSFRQLIFKLNGIEDKFYQKKSWVYAQNNLSLLSFNYLDAIKILMEYLA